MWAWWRQLRGAPPCLLQTVIVNLKDDPTQAIHGVCFDWRGRWLILRQPSLLKIGEAPTASDGDILIHASNISFLVIDRPRE
jgi:hypothetical protein